MSVTTNLAQTLVENQEQVRPNHLVVPVNSPGGTLLAAVDQLRARANALIAPRSRALLGQFLTPASVGWFMASMFRVRRNEDVRLLDPGAGIGSLAAAYIARQLDREVRPKSVFITAYEIDPTFSTFLAQTIELCRAACQKDGILFECDIREGDYLAARAGAAVTLFRSNEEKYDCIIMNPPYRKIRSTSAERRNLGSVGIETSNLYTGFMLLAAKQLEMGGEIVSINPRSFCNGPYFRAFRREFFDIVSLDEIHVFEARDQLFKDDGVLQENIILHGTRNGHNPRPVVVSCTSPAGHLRRRRVQYRQVIRKEDPDAVLHIVVDAQADEISKRILCLKGSLEGLGSQVSTGRVVDFRARDYLRKNPELGTVPLIYPAHFADGQIAWPNSETRKPNAILESDETRGLLVPRGYYVLVKRFSAKEERRRIVAAVLDPDCVRAASVGIENHLNYYHNGGRGLPEDLARGMAIFLNSTLVDEYFRLFSGHTQVNAADLRRIPYPMEKQLRLLSAKCDNLADQLRIDAAVNDLVPPLHSI